MSKRLRAAAVLVPAYLAVIVAANFISAHYGKDASVVNAFFLVGFAITTRDYLHDLWAGHRLRNMALLILAGSTVSYLSSLVIKSSALPSHVVARIALASACAFAVSESFDAIVYHILRHHQWLERSNGSNIASAILDSTVFVSIAFGFDWLVVFGQMTAKIAGGFIWSWVMKHRRADEPPLLVPEAAR